MQRGVTAFEGDGSNPKSGASANSATLASFITKGLFASGSRDEYTVKSTGCKEESLISTNRQRKKTDEKEKLAFR